MHYLNIGLDSPVSVFSIAQAHAQLEADYNVGGILRERPSNRRRNISTGSQLARMRYRNPFYWVDICAPFDDSAPDDEDVRDIYMRNVLKWGLPIDADLLEAMRARFTPDFLNQHLPKEAK